LTGTYEVALLPSGSPYATTPIGEIDLTHAVTRDLVVIR
jgi:hypothetical protein